MIIEYLLDPQTWMALLTLTVLEIVLGIDNLVFLAIVSNRLPLHQQAKARRIGLAAALILRVGFLLTLTWIAQATTPIFTVADFAVSWRDVILGVGGLYLVYKIMILDLVFSLDSIITAVGMTNNRPVMVAAVVIAIIVMMFAAGSVSGFINKHPTVKMLALSFLILVGTALIADASHFHIPREYLYFAIAFSIGVEGLNLWMRQRAERREAEKSTAT